MKNLSTAIYSQAKAATTFWTAIGGKFYKKKAPANATYPYVIYDVIDENGDGTFTEEIEEHLCQFSIISADNSSTEAEDVYTLLRAVFDKCELTITGYTNLHTLWQHSTLFEDELPNPNGTGWVWHYAIDYNIMIQKN